MCLLIKQRTRLGSNPKYKSSRWLHFTFTTIFKEILKTIFLTQKCEVINIYFEQYNKYFL